MSEPKAVSLHDVGKMYKIYPSRLDAVLDTTGLSRLMPWHKAIAQEFWALRNIDLEVKKGERLGIIGRNGAGKSTLLKLLTGNLSPTEGSVEVNGSIQALLTAGAGFHPEFTGIENIQSSLTYQGQTPEEIARAVAEIAEFTELGDFLSQPFKVYSAGMQARLTFATATVLNPDILIVDEILGAGDAYFFGKSMERMKNLVLSGATVLIVSHALDQITRFCERAIWIDRGRVVYSGPAMDTITAYEEFIHKLEERRLRAKNQKLRDEDGESSQDILLSNSLTFIIRPKKQNSYIDVSKLDIFEGDLLYETLRVGDVQDSNASHVIYALVSPTEGWSNPMKDSSRYFRRINHSGSDKVGQIVLYMYNFNPGLSYESEITYRSNEDIQLEVWKNGELLTSHIVENSQNGWKTNRLSIGELKSHANNGHLGAALTQTDDVEKQATDQTVVDRPTQKIRRWPGSNDVIISSILLLDKNFKERYIYHAGEPITFRINIEAKQDGVFPIRPAISFYRLDGVFVTNQVADQVITSPSLNKGDRFYMDLCFDAINLGTGNYVLSGALFKDRVVEEERYDLTDRSHEFEVINSDDHLKDAIFRHPGTWRMSPI